MNDTQELFTREQLDIALLKDRNDGILRTLTEIKTEIKSQFHLTIGLIMGLYAVIGGTAIAKVCGAF